MCVIFLASAKRPTEEMVRRAWEANSHGAGIAWRDRDQVAWKKGVMDVEQAVQLAAETPLPYCMHFRIASIGGVKPELTHPFTVSAEVKLDLEGRTDKAVLFHNGHWGFWNDKALDAAIHSNTKLPEGSQWSDSRAMAFLVHIYGSSVMDMLTTQKAIIMLPRKFLVYTGSAWTRINDVWCSNDYFWIGKRTTHGHTTNNTSYGLMCSASRCTEKRVAGSDLCLKCLEARRLAAEAIAADANKVVAKTTTTPSPVAIVTGGAERPGPLARMFSMSEVENFYRAGHLSKSVLKKYRKANSLSQERGNKAQRGLTTMSELSVEIAEIVMSVAGPAH